VNKAMAETRVGEIGTVEPTSKVTAVDVGDSGVGLEISPGRSLTHVSILISSYTQRVSQKVLNWIFRLKITYMYGSFAKYQLSDGSPLVSMVSIEKFPQNIQYYTIFLRSMISGLRRINM
jgi:hypothetical protein